MARATHLTSLDLARLLPVGGIVIAMTDDGSDPRYAAVRAAAASIAAKVGGKVLLFDSTAGQGDTSARTWPLLDQGPLPEEDPLHAHCDSQRRHALRLQAESIRIRGTDAAVWVTERPSVAGMAEAVTLTRAALVLMPAEVDRPGLIHRTLDYRAARIPAPVVAVDPAGVLALVPPLGSPPSVDHRLAIRVEGSGAVTDGSPTNLPMFATSPPRR